MYEVVTGHHRIVFPLSFKICRLLVELVRSTYMYVHIICLLLLNHLHVCELACRGTVHIFHVHVVTCTYMHLAVLPPSLPNLTL